MMSRSWFCVAAFWTCSPGGCDWRPDHGRVPWVTSHVPMWEEDFLSPCESVSFTSDPFPVCFGLSGIKKTTSVTHGIDLINLSHLGTSSIFTAFLYHLQMFMDLFNPSKLFTCGTRVWLGARACLPIIHRLWVQSPVLMKDQWTFFKTFTYLNQL